MTISDAQREMARTVAGEFPGGQGQSVVFKENGDHAWWTVKIENGAYQTDVDLDPSHDPDQWTGTLEAAIDALHASAAN